MTPYDVQYLTIAKEILEHGELKENRTGVKAYSLPQQILQLDLTSFPILESKKVGWKTAIKEMLWIWQKQSNVVQDLRDENVNIWNEWELPDGTIGKAYGYQLGIKNTYKGIDVNKYLDMASKGQIKCVSVIGYMSQVDKLLYDLKYNQNSRRMVTSLWNVSDLYDMALEPCAFLTMWNVHQGKLNCTLVQRSGDFFLGIPYNDTQYAVLTHMLAELNGLSVGTLTHVINDAHIYENHVEQIKTQLQRYKDWENEVFLRDNDDNPYITIEERLNRPKFSLADKDSFYDYVIDDFKLENYNPCGVLKGAVAV